MGKLAKKQVKKLKAKHDEAFDKAADAVAADPVGASVDEEWQKGELVGRDCRMIDEKVHATFGAPAKVIGHLGDQVRLEVEGIFHSVVCKVQQIDLLPQLVGSMPKLPLQLSNQIKTELVFKFPHLDTLEMKDRLSGDHVMLGAWVVDRETGFPQGVVMIQPSVIVAWTAGILEPGPDGQSCKDKAEMVIMRKFRRFGLIGVPVWSSCEGEGTEHWTLLVVRRLPEIDGIPQLQVRYYDSAEQISVTNLSSAELVLDLFTAELGLPKIEIERTNSAEQHNPIDCGTFSLHYWEGEVRRFRAEGWPLPYPWTTGPIKDRRKRLVSLVSQVRKYMQQLQQQEADDAKAAADGKAIKKKKEIVVADKDISVEERASAALSQADLRMLELAEVAKKAADQGIVPFYGCSRCRYSRGGCIS